MVKLQKKMEFCGTVYHLCIRYVDSGVIVEYLSPKLKVLIKTSNYKTLRECAEEINAHPVIPGQRSVTTNKKQKKKREARKKRS